MKRLIVLFLTVAFFSKCKQAQLPMNTDNKVCYSGIVEIPNKTQEKLYADSKEYVLLNYTSREFPTILDEKNDRIYIKGKFKVPIMKYAFPIFVSKSWWELVYTAKFYYKDGKYRYEITDMFIMKKNKAKVTGSYWGGGYSGTITEAQIVKRDMEFIYSVKRYRTQFAQICWKIDDGIKLELAKYEKYMNQENNQKNW